MVCSSQQCCHSDSFGMVKFKLQAWTVLWRDRTRRDEGRRERENCQPARDTGSNNTFRRTRNYCVTTRFPRLARLGALVHTKRLKEESRRVEDMCLWGISVGGEMWGAGFDGIRPVKFKPIHFVVRWWDRCNVSDREGFGSRKVFYMFCYPELAVLSWSYIWPTTVFTSEQPSRQQPLRPEARCLGQVPRA